MKMGIVPIYIYIYPNRSPLWWLINSHFLWLTFPNISVPVPLRQLKEWSSGHFDCLSEPAICCASCCCPCIRWAEPWVIPPVISSRDVGAGSRNPAGKRLRKDLVGGDWNLGILNDFPFSWEYCNHPNWLIFFRGVETTNQTCQSECGHYFLACPIIAFLTVLANAFSEWGSWSWLLSPELWNPADRQFIH